MGCLKARRVPRGLDATARDHRKPSKGSRTVARSMAFRMGRGRLSTGVEAVCWALARAEKAAEHRAASAGRYRAEAALMEQTLAHRASELVAKDEVEQSWREYVATVGRKLQRLAAMPAFDGCRAALQRELETLLQAHGRVGGDGVR